MSNVEGQKKLFPEMLPDIKVVTDPKPPPGMVVLDYKGQTFTFGKNRQGGLICVSQMRHSRISTAEDLSLQKMDWAALFKKAGKEFSKKKKIIKSILKRKTVDSNQRDFIKEERLYKNQFPEDDF